MKRRLNLVALTLCAGVSLPSLACRHRSAPDPGTPEPKAAEYPGPLLDPRVLGSDFQWRQRVTARWSEQQARSFEAVLSKSDDMLILLGLSPMGMPGFVLRLQDGAVTFENHGAEPLPFPPEYIVLDVERAYFPWFPEQEPIPADGSRVVEAHGERITEHWSAGKLERRTFERLDGVPAGAITVSYSGWTAQQQAPALTKLDNGWFGYSLQIDTLEQLRL